MVRKNGQDMTDDKELIESSLRNFLKFLPTQNSNRKKVKYANMIYFIRELNKIYGQDKYILKQEKRKLLVKYEEKKEMIAPDWVWRKINEL